MKTVDGAAPLLLLVAALMLLTFVSRETRVTGDPASFLRPGATVVQLGQGFTSEGVVCQFSDGPGWRGVIELTDLPLSAACRQSVAGLSRPESGTRIDLVVQDGVVARFSFSWMPAAQRVALGIPLHPDRMQGADWEALPGIGPKLAERIERDRQKNGDFGSLQGLLRVQGVGQKRVNEWMPYFFVPLSVEKID